MGRKALTPGEKYGRLTSIRFIEKSRIGHSIWLWKCDCGNEHKATVQRVKSGKTSSCGCYASEKRRTTGGYHGSYVHRIWVAMLRRCDDDRLPAYPNYGGRGIRVCPRWQESFLNFLEDMGEPPTDNHTIDRKDNEGDYEPGNCRWLTRQEQQRNKRTNRWVEFRGRLMVQVECCELLGINANAFRNWIDKGLSADEVEIVVKSGISWRNPSALFYIATPDSPIEKALARSRYVILNTQKLSDETIKYKVIWDPIKLRRLSD